MPGMPDVETERPMSATSQRAVIVVHGGAGVPLPQLLDDEQRVAALRGLNQALRSAHELLADGGSALDAVELAVRTMEDDPAFNAGVGAALTRDGHAEHEAAIMDGRSGLAGAQVLIDFLLSPQAQARKADIRVWGDPTVLAVDRLAAADKALFTQAQAPGAVAQSAPALPEPHASWVEAIEREWLKRYGQ